MPRKWLGPFLCLVVILCLMGGLLHLADTPREGASPEGTASDTAEPPPLDLTTAEDDQGRPVFSFSLEELILCYNHLWQEEFLPSPDLWTHSASLSQEEVPVGDCFSASPDQEIWFLPTLSVYTHGDTPSIWKVSVDLDEHSDSPEKHDLFRQMSLHALALFFPGLDQEAREALYLALDDQAYTSLYTGFYHADLIPQVLYYQDGIGVFPFFAIGEYERFSFLPVTQDQLDIWSSQGTLLVDLNQWKP